MFANSENLEQSIPTAFSTPVANADELLERHVAYVDDCRMKDILGDLSSCALRKLTRR